MEKRLDSKKYPSPYLHSPSPTTMPIIEDIKITTFEEEVSIHQKVLDTMAVSTPSLPQSTLCQPQTSHQN
jgi:hypothetical protein